MANRFENLRLRLMGESAVDEQRIQIDTEDPYGVILKSIKGAQAQEVVEKGMQGKEVAYSEPVIGSMSVNPEFKDRPSSSGVGNLHNVLKAYGNNIILNAIITTRSNQVSSFCQPARYSEKGLGFQVRLKDINLEPNKHELATIRKIESFILNTGEGIDTTRDSFTDFTKKIIRDTYRFDQVNFEKVIDRNGNFIRFVVKDPTTIYFATDENGHVPTTGIRYVQVMDGRVVAKFTARDMAFAVRNPRSDIYSAGYGYSELEIALKHFIAHENTERFNDRFFSHGGTTRGILQIKTDGNQSQHALDMFKREWKNSLSGINGSWQIPIVSADAVNFVNMTPSARDMEFEKWLNYLINAISALYSIDPAEINFPNNGGATGSSGGSLNEGNSSEKTQASQNKGLIPLLNFIADTVNKFIISEFGDKYLFQFVGGDTTTELEKIKILAEKAKVAMTINEVRKQLGLAGDIPGGDVIANGVHIQRLGQLVQEDQFVYQKQQDNLSKLMEQTGGTMPDTASNVGPTFQDKQQGLAGNSDSVNGKGTTGSIGKDGQDKNQENTNSAGEGGKGDK